MEYLNSHLEIVNRVGREITGITSENSMKNVFADSRQDGHEYIRFDTTGKKTRSSSRVHGIGLFAFTRGGSVKIYVIPMSLLRKIRSLYLPPEGKYSTGPPRITYIRGIGDGTVPLLSSSRLGENFGSTVNGRVMLDPATAGKDDFNAPTAVFPKIQKLCPYMQLWFFCR